MFEFHVELLGYVQAVRNVRGRTLNLR